MRRTLIFILLLAIILLIFLISAKNDCQNINCINFPGSNEYREKEIYTDERGNFRALLANNREYIKLEIRANKEESEFLKIKNENLANAELFYQKSAAPYPGEISDSITCDKNRIPKIKSNDGINTKVYYFSSKLNDRFVYSCTQDEDRFNGMTILFYCRNQKKGYVLEFIYGLNELDKNFPSIIKSVKCL